MAKILLVEDETSLRAAIAYNLARAGHDVRSAADGEAALALAAAEPPDLVLLDVMLPTIDGFEVCRQLRRASAVPILMLTARDDEIDRVVGLEIGADDYVTKPFSMRELLARVKALLRRRQLLAEELAQSAEGRGERLAVGDLELDLAARRVLRAGEEVPLRPKEFDLLAYLVRHRGMVRTTDQILDAVWGYGAYGGSRTLAVHVHSLREKLEPDPTAPTLIETVRGVGYRFNVNG